MTAGHPSGVVVVGGSAAGLAVVEGLRARGYEADITWIGDERHLPYDRPPLSKHYLTGAWEEDALDLRQAEAIEALNCDLRVGIAAMDVDVARRRLAVSTGEGIDFEHLVIATGCSARLPLPWRGISGVHVLRTIEDARAIRSALPTARRVVLAGAGFIGAEVAGVCRQAGAEVTLVDPIAAPMTRALGPLLGDIMADLHRENGVTLRLGVGVARIETDGGRLRSVLLNNGESIQTDLVLAGLGADPNVAWLANSGLSIGDGLLCDEHCRAAPGVYAAGDVASWISRRFGRRMRVEHRTNATEQGDYVAAQLVGDGEGEPYGEIPFFWSDQYGQRLQLHGDLRPTDEMVVIDGNPAERSFVAACGRKGGAVRAVVGMNMPRQLTAARTLITDSAPWDELLPVAG